MNKVYCLYRVSDQGQVEKDDIPMQKIACHSFAAEHGWEIVQEFSEKGVSGYKLTLQERDALLKIREDTLVGKFDILLVYMFDRIGRRDDETPFVVEWFVRNGIAVWSVCEGEQRFDNHVDKLTNYIRYWQAAGESAKIAERTRTRIRQLTAEGAYTGGVCPFGYGLVRGQRCNKKKQPLYDLQIDEKEAAVVQLIFEKVVKNGYGIHRMTNYLNENGYRTRKGKRWSPSTVARILQNPIYTGVLHKGGVESDQLPELQIIDQDIFQSSQEIRESRNSTVAQSRTVPMQTRGVTLLSGFLYCGHCGARINGTSQSRQYTRKDGSVQNYSSHRYRCNGSVDGEPTQCDGQHIYDAEIVDGTFKKVIIAILDQLESLSADAILERKYRIAISARRKAVEEVRVKLLQHRQDYDTLRGEIARALQGKSQFDCKLLQSVLNDTERRIEQTKESLLSLENQMKDVDQLRREIGLNQQKYTDLKECFVSGTMEEKKMLLSQMIERVELKSRYEMKITLSPSFDQFLDGLAIR